MRLKLLVVLLVVSSVAAVPLKKPSDKLFKERSKITEEEFEEILERQNKAFGVSQRRVPYSEEYRLPDNTVPLHYDLSLRTDIHLGDFVFYGSVRIDIRVAEVSNTITLHSRRTIIEEITLRNPDGSIFQSNVQFTYDSLLEFLVLHSNRDFELDQELEVEI